MFPFAEIDPTPPDEAENQQDEVVVEPTIKEPMQENKGAPQDVGAPQNEGAQPIQDQPVAEEPRQSRSG